VSNGTVKCPKNICQAGTRKKAQETTFLAKIWKSAPETSHTQQTPLNTQICCFVLHCLLPLAASPAFF